MPKRFFRKFCGKRRTGVAATELAVCLPAIIVLVFASIECCSMIYLTQALHAATYEGARVAIQRTSTKAQVEERVTEILTGHSVAGATVTCSPTDPTTAAAGSKVVITVRVPCDSNRIAPTFFFGGRTLEVKTTMAKEG
jgi:Flp pilus assembly protein TadG